MIYLQMLEVSRSCFSLETSCKERATSCLTVIFSLSARKEICSRRTPSWALEVFKLDSKICFLESTIISSEKFRFPGRVNIERASVSGSIEIRFLL